MTYDALWTYLLIHVFLGVAVVAITWSITTVEGIAKSDCPLIQTVTKHYPRDQLSKDLRLFTMDSLSSIFT